MPSAARLAACLALVALAPLAGAQVLYKWTDKDGKVQYSDQPPKHPPGVVTHIEPDVAPTVVPSPPKAAAPSAAPKEAKDEPPDLVTKRRAIRAQLGKNLAAARARLAAARKALAEAEGPEPEERQIVRQDQKAGQGGMHGLSAARSNCVQTVKDGKKGVMCPAMIANDAYFERMGKLESEVRDAEAEVAEAENAWRRGVD